MKLFKNNFLHWPILFEIIKSRISSLDDVRDLVSVDLVDSINKNKAKPESKSAISSGKKSKQNLPSTTASSFNKLPPNSPPYVYIVRTCIK